MIVPIDAAIEAILQMVLGHEEGLRHLLVIPDAHPEPIREIPLAGLPNPLGLRHGCWWICYDVMLLMIICSNQRDRYCLAGSRANQFYERRYTGPALSAKVHR